MAKPIQAPKTGEYELRIFKDPKELAEINATLDAGELVEKWLQEEGLSRWDLIGEPRLDELFERAYEELS